MRLIEPAQLMLAERFQRFAVGTCEIVAHDQRQIKGLRDGFDAADQIDGRPYHREIEAIGRSDVAVDDRAIVEGDDDFQRRFARRRRSRTPDTERCQRLSRGLKGISSGAGGLVRIGHRKDRKQSVPDEFQNLAAMAHNRLR